MSAEEVYQRLAVLQQKLIDAGNNREPALDVAMSEVRKQIKVVPLNKESYVCFTGSLAYTGVCPRCRTRLDTPTATYRCPLCGQLLQWVDDAEQ